MRIGVDVGGTKIEGVALDARGEVRARRRVATPRGDYDATLACIAELVRHLEEEAGGARACVGLGIPGAISPASGLVKNANSTWLIGRPLDRDLARRLQRPVRVENDANCFAVSEASDGAAAGARVVFGVIVGTGCGGGLVVDGRPWRGRQAVAGEWGHNPLPWPRDDEHPGPPCYCGKRGCIETFLSGTGVSRDHEERTGEALPVEAIVARAEAGDVEAEETLARLEHRMARALASVINVLDPDAIVLGGGLSNVQRLYDRVPALWPQWVFSDEVTTPLLAPAHGDASGVRGAAWLWPPDAGTQAARWLVHVLPAGVAYDGRAPLEPPSLAREGFVHLCHVEQTAGVLARHFPGQTVRALMLDAARLQAPVVDEDLYGHGAFPHLYGPIPHEAVRAEVELEAGIGDASVRERLEAAATDDVR